MAQEKTLKNHQSQHGKENEMVEVLYQKLGDRWFAFSLIDEEVFVGSISPEELETPVARDTRSAKAALSGEVFRKAGRS